MTGKEIYKIWAPIGAKWCVWIRPVPFIAINDSLKVYEISNFSIPNINYICEKTSDTAIIVDMPGNLSVKEGISLAKLGYRLVPIYNGTNEQEGAMATVDNHSVTTSLIFGAEKLKNIKIDDDAPPAFLLDSNRTNRFKMNVSIFDNSWDIYPQDVPSAEYFLNNGIKKIIVRGEFIQKDLKKILYKFQKKGIKILFTNGYDEPKVVNIKRQFNRKND